MHADVSVYTTVYGRLWAYTGEHIRAIVGVYERVWAYMCAYMLAYTGDYEHIWEYMLAYSQRIRAIIGR